MQCMKCEFELSPGQVPRGLGDSEVGGVRIRKKIDDSEVHSDN